ncbi:MAG: hypothetical protein NC541_13705 [bacterium]|nr:hypothetical protein [bacterium]
MKKKETILLAVLILAVAGGLIWWIAPTRLLGRVDLAEVAEIRVFSGTTGEGFTVSDPEQITYIVESFQSTSLKRYGFSLGHTGYGYRMSFADGNGKILASLILNGESSLRRDPFFYEPREGTLCYEYLQELEKREKQSVFRAVIREIGSRTMIVTPLSEDGDYRVRDEIAVSMSLLPEDAEPQVGDIVIIAFNGEIMETYPAQLGEVYSITLEE